ncbi:MAG: serine protease [Lachnospiraceae bacterium]|jgi:serine protease Do|nr:serine protease [Lachnospiraceae bacterium]
MSEKEQKKKEKELKNMADEIRDSDKNPNMQRQPENGNQAARNESGGKDSDVRNSQGRMPVQQPGPGNYNYQNPYQNNWQNQRYYGNDFGRRGGNGYNNYPNQNYGNMPQGNPYAYQGGYQQGNYAPQGGNAGAGDNGGKKKTGTGKKVLWGVCISAFLILCISGIYYTATMFNTDEQEAQQAAAEPQNPQIGQVDLDAPENTEGTVEDTPKPAQGNLMDVSELVERIMPTVVSVNAVYTYDSYYWDDEKYDGGGSGFIIGENETELLIATNSHVVADSEDLTVSFVDKTDADAMVKGYDNDLDVAVLAVPLADISDETKAAIAVARLGDSTSLKAGQAVISIGNALLLGQSVTTGIVSATNMPVGGGYDEMGNQYGSDDRVMIQTTAFMNPGCSGGVLINASGEVVGINTMTISSVDVEGMCYAIPISDAIPVLDNLKKREIRERLREDESGYLGISCSNVERKQAEEFGIPDGVYVREANEDGPADKAGIRKGDVIVSINEVKVSTMNELSEMLRYYPVGEIVEVEIMRYEEGEYQSQIISVKLGRK